ncbi:MAG TPA: AMIN domain-containing protein, partial [Crinalium sp.]
MKWRWFLPGFLGVFLMGGAAQTDTVIDWHFDRDRNQLEFRTDEYVQPSVQLISNPTRLVIDLPGIVLGHPLVNQPVGNAIQEVRIGQFNPYTTRIVVALDPGYTLDPNQVKVRGDSPSHWQVQLPSPQRLSDDSVSVSPDQPDSQTIGVIQPQMPPTLNPRERFADVVALQSPLVDLQTQIQSVMGQYNFLQSGMFFLDLETGNYVNVGGDRVFPA